MLSLIGQHPSRLQHQATRDREDQAMTEMDKLQSHLLRLKSPTYSAYYNGKMSYTLHGTAWETYVTEAFPDLKNQNTSENIFKSVIDLYAENLIPRYDEMRDFSNTVVPLLCRGAAPVLVLADGTPSFPEHYELVSDGKFSIAALFTRSLEKMEDYVTYAYSDGRTELFKKDVPDDLSPASEEGYQHHESLTGATLLRFALDDKGFGATLAALQDRLNHSIIDQTVVEEMYARPFWFLMNVELPPVNPFLPATAGAVEEIVKERKGGDSAPRMFTTNGEGPFGQLEPPTITDMIAYHDSIIDKVPLTTGIPQHYFKPGAGTPPTGVALKVLMKRFSNRISRMRADIEPQLEELAILLGIEKDVEVEQPKKTDPETGEAIEISEEATEMEYGFWDTEDDLLQEALDAHGVALTTMGYPLAYIASVVTPGVDLDDYEDDSLGEPVPPAQGEGEPVDMTATGQVGLVPTATQVQNYEQNPGQRKRG
ncbi:portal protein [Microbacterium phage McGalleon]|uniref:Portal protein n=1 Tax=Microbacterium phage McGalleon TaxID=2590936 RepID=A0A516KQS8_9CAUD|nr:portal protein [Microbacterium phage McGalleon]QDP44056.1 portal protein [Microbacterium phage McGalleon]